MKSIRNFVYAAVLTFSALNFAPSLASAQEEGGSFTLAHEVHLAKCGGAGGRVPILPSTHGTFRNAHPNQNLPANQRRSCCYAKDTDARIQFRASTARNPGRSSERAFVSAMDLPQFEVTLHFAVPANSGKEVAEMHTASAASAIAARRTESRSATGLLSVFLVCTIE